MEDLNKVIIDVIGVDIMNPKRTRDEVDARRVFAKILRDRGYSYQRIGDALNKNHSTIIHYIRNIDELLKYDKALDSMYRRVLKKHQLGHDPLLDMSESELREKVRELRDIVDGLSLNIKQLSAQLREKRHRDSRLDDIVKVLQLRMPEGAEKVVEAKLISILNGLR